jgi:hypothetical protein
MPYISAGVTMVADGSEIPTKMAFKKLLKDEPSELLFINFSYGLGPGELKYRGSELDPALAYQVAGPNAETNRKWFARVEVRDGKPVVVA